MSEPLSRRDALKQLGSAGAGVVLVGGGIRDQSTPIRLAGMPVEIAVAPVSASTVRITATAIPGTGSVPEDGALVAAAEAKPVARGRAAAAFKPVKAGNFVVRYTAEPPTIHIDAADGQTVQQLVLHTDEPGMSFLLPKGPLLGLGEGGPQFDRKGSVDLMRNGQGGTVCGCTAAVCRSSGSLARTAGGCTSITRLARSISPARPAS